jgi:hypothetical protein
MKRVLIAAIAAALLGLGVATAPQASAAVCTTKYSNWDVYEGSLSWITNAKIHTTHYVCVTTTGYTYRWASMTIETTNAGNLAGYVYKLGPATPYQQTATFDGWYANGKYQVCIWKYGVQACPPNWGTFQVIHRIARYDSSTTVVVTNDSAYGTNVWGGDFHVKRP